MINNHKTAFMTCPCCSNPIVSFQEAATGLGTRYISRSEHKRHMSYTSERFDKSGVRKNPLPCRTDAAHYAIEVDCAKCNITLVIIKIIVAGSTLTEDGIFDGAIEKWSDVKLKETRLDQLGASIICEEYRNVPKGNLVYNVVQQHFIGPFIPATSQSERLIAALLQQ